MGISRLPLTAAAFALVLGSVGGGGTGAARADTVLLDGKILTVDAKTIVTQPVYFIQHVYSLSSSDDFNTKPRRQRNSNPSI